MKILYNTSDVLYDENDIVSAFHHAYHVAKSDWRGTPAQAFGEWKAEYINNMYPTLSLKVVSEAVLAVRNVVRDDVIDSSSRNSLLVFARHLICWFAWRYTFVEAKDIAAFMKYKNHSSVFHSIKHINEGMVYDKKKICNAVNEVKMYLHSQGYLLQTVSRPGAQEYDTKIVK